MYWWTRPIVKLEGQSAVLTQGVRDLDDVLTTGEGRVIIDEGSTPEEITQTFLCEYPSMKGVLALGILPVVREGVVEVWRWEPADDPADCCRVENLDEEGARCDLIITPPQPRMVEVAHVGNVRGYALRNAVLRILLRVAEEYEALKEQGPGYQWWSTWRGASPDPYKLPIAVVPTQGVEWRINNDHVSAICTGVVYNAFDEIVALQVVATTKEALKSVFGTLSSNSKAKGRLYLSPEAGGYTSMKLYPMKAASKRRYRSTFAPLPDGTGWQATFVHVAALPEEMETDDGGQAYLIFEGEVSGEEMRRRILRLLNARLPFPFPEAWAAESWYRGKGEGFWEAAKGQMRRLARKGKVFSGGLAIDVGNVHAWSEAVKAVNTNE